MCSARSSSHCGGGAATTRRSRASLAASWCPCRSFKRFKRRPSRGSSLLVLLLQLQDEDNKIGHPRPPCYAVGHAHRLLIRPSDSVLSADPLRIEQSKGHATKSSSAPCCKSFFSIGLRICCIALIVGGLSSLVLDFIGYIGFTFFPHQELVQSGFGDLSELVRSTGWWASNVSPLDLCMIAGREVAPSLFVNGIFRLYWAKGEEFELLPPCFCCPFSYHLQFCFSFLHLIVYLKQLGSEALHHTMCTADGIDCFVDVIDFIVLANQIISTARIALICMPENFRECWTCHLFM